jgi:hypothetical protein
VDATENGHPAVDRLAKARAELDEERKARSEACKREIAACLERHRCRLDVAVILREGSVSPAVNVVPVD